MLIDLVRAQIEIDRFRKDWPAIQKKTTDQKMWNVYMEGQCEEMLERLMLWTVLKTPAEQGDWNSWKQEKEAALKQVEKKRKDIIKKYRPLTARMKQIVEEAGTHFDKEGNPTVDMVPYFREMEKLNCELEMLCIDYDLHDKHCSCAKYIPDEDLLWSEEYVTDLKPCSDCMLQAYVSAGAKDPKEIEKYRAFFDKTQLSIDQIRNIYVENGMKTRISMDAMTIWYKEDTWRIKCLPKKGRVQLYHNNYVVRKKGVREFTQGFHIQNPACSDTNIGYALYIIKNYEYKPEEYALHNGKVNPIERKKAKQHQAEKMEMNAVSLEEMLGDKTAEQTLWQKIKFFVSRLFKKRSFFELNDFQLVSDQGYPKNQTICIYVWKDKNGQLSWQTGIYNQKLKHFSVRYGATVYSIKQDKVIAWKKMSADAVALEIEDKRYLRKMDTKMGHSDVIV